MRVTPSFFHLDSSSSYCLLCQNTRGPPQSPCSKSRLRKSEVGNGDLTCLPLLLLHLLHWRKWVSSLLCCFIWATLRVDPAVSSVVSRLSPACYKISAKNTTAQCQHHKYSYLARSAAIMKFMGHITMCTTRSDPRAGYKHFPLYMKVRGICLSVLWLHIYPTLYIHKQSTHKHRWCMIHSGALIADCC